MPAWLHERARHIQAKNPSMPEGEAFAIATQQSHALGKTPKSYGTAKGREVAKAKFKTPDDDVKTAGLGQILTTPIPGTPSILPHVADSFAKALGSRSPPAAVAPVKKTLEQMYAARRAAVKTSSAVTLNAFVDELEKIALSPAVEAKGAISGLMRKAERVGAVDALQNTGAWKQLQSHAQATGLPFDKARNPIFSKLHDRLGTYIKQQGAVA